MSALPILLLGGAAVMMMGGGGKKRKGPDAWMKALASKTGNPDFDATSRAPELIILELQQTLDIEPADGRWRPRLELAVKQMYREL